MVRLKISPGTLALLIAIVLVVTAAGSVLAQQRASDSPTTTAAPPSDAPPPKVLTGKERLGEKWTDEQRVDNCRVPLDKRGAKPRPDACSDGSQQLPP
jgi:hypothetical protein